MAHPSTIRHVIDHEKLNAMAADWSAKHGSTEDPLERMRAVCRASSTDDDEEPAASGISIRAQLAWLGFQKATKRELRDIIMKAMERDPDA